MEFRKSDAYGRVYLNYIDAKGRRTMNKRMKVTVFAACALLMCLMATVAFADYRESKATISEGSKNVEGADKYLHPVTLYGKVSSTSGSGTEKLTGSMWTYYYLGPFNRGSASVDVGKTSSTFTWASDVLGYFYSKAVAPGANHNGYCKAWQNE